VRRPELQLEMSVLGDVCVSPVAWAVRTRVSLHEEKGRAREEPRDSPPTHHSAIRHGERSFHDASTSDAHAVGLSAWPTVHALGIFIASLSAGVTKRNV